MSHTSVRRVEGKDLHPWKDERGRWRFDEDEVRAYQPRRRRPATTARGRLAGAVFRMFDEGADHRDIVMQLQVEPRIVRALDEEWRIDLETGRHLRRNQRRADRARADERLRLQKQALDQQPFTQFENVRLATEALEAALKRNDELGVRLERLQHDHAALLALLPKAEKAAARGGLLEQLLAAASAGGTSR